MIFINYILPIGMAFLFIYLNNCEVKTKIRIFNDQINKKDKELSQTISENQNVIHTFQNFHQTKLFEISISYLKLRIYQEKLIDYLDPIIDFELIKDLENNIYLIDEALKETALISSTIVTKSDLSLISEIYKDKEAFKN